MRKMLAVALIVVAGLFMLSVPNVIAGPLEGMPCKGDFDCDGAVASNDVSEFLIHTGRNVYNDPCPSCQDSPCPCTVCPYGMVDCGTKCVDPNTDEDFCGADNECVGGTVCGTTEKCAGGVCEDVGGGGVYQAGVEKTGQTTCYDSIGTIISCTDTGQDGEYQNGVAWPNPRFTDNLDGSITDNLTGLIWLKDANCIATNYPGFDNDGRVTWQHALDFVAGINAGIYPSCGAGSTDWRLPNRNELESLVHKGYYIRAIPNTAGTGQWSAGDPFTNVQSSYYWSSTTLAYGTGGAWCVTMDGGDVHGGSKTNVIYVWPVRGGD